MRFYKIEKTDNANHYGDYKYRFRSLYNSCVGSWSYKKEKAVEDGESHRDLVFLIHGLK